MSNRLAKAFGTALRETRNKRAMSILELSVASELDRSFIWQLEMGNKNASLQTVFKLAAALQIAPAELMKLTSKWLE